MPTPTQQAQYAADMLAGLGTPTAPTTPQPVVKQEALTVSEAEARIQELEEQAQAANKLAGMEGTIELSEQEAIRQSQQQSVYQAEAQRAADKAKLLRQYIDKQKQLENLENLIKQGAVNTALISVKSDGKTIYGQKALNLIKSNIQEYGGQIASIVSSRMSPFITSLKVDKRNRISYTIDVPMALQAGVGPQTLRDYGVTSEQIGRARVDISQGITSWQQPSGESQQQVIKYRVQQTALKKLQNYTNTEGVDVQQWFIDYPKGTQILIDAGFDRDTVDEWAKNTQDLLAEAKQQGGDLYSILKNKGYEPYLTALATDFERSNTKLPDGAYLSNDVIAGIKSKDEDLYNLLMSRGLTAYNIKVQAINDAVERLNEYPVMIAVYDEKGIKTYRPSKGGQLDLIAAYQAGRMQDIRLLFGAETLNEIKETIRVDKAKDEYSKYGNLRLAVLNGMSDTKLKLLFTDKEVDKAHNSVSQALTAEKRLIELESKVQSGQRLSLSEINERNTLLTIMTQQTFPVAADVLFSQMIPEGISKILDRYVNPVSRLVSAVMPAIISIPTRYAIGWFVERPLYAMGFTSALIGTVYSINPALAALNLANGVGQFFMSIPAQIAVDPERAANLVGVFLSPTKLKSVVTRFDPAFIPSRGISLEFSVGKLPVTFAKIQELIRSGRLTEVKLANAISRVQQILEKNPKIDATYTIPGTGLVIAARTTPWLKQLGFGVWHATPDYNPFLSAKAIVEAVNKKQPALFTSPSAAPRFALMSASGVAGVRPALLSIITKDGIRDYPVIVRKAQSMAEMTRQGFKYLGSGAASGAYSVIKTYAKRFENEILIAVGTELVRVKNLRSRILGIKAGEFVTVVDGVVIPIMRFAEKGTTVPKVSLSMLAAIKVEVVIATIKRLRIDLKTLSLYLKTERGLTIAELAAEFERIGLEAAKGKKGKVAEAVYRRAVDDAMAKELRTLYNYMKQPLERYYRANPARFEEVYRAEVSRSLVRTYKTTYVRANIPREMEARIIEQKREPLTRAEINRVREQIERQLSTVRRSDTRRGYEPAETVDRVERVEREPAERIDRVEPIEKIDRVEREKEEIITPKEKLYRVSDKDIEDIKKRKAPICWRQGIVWYVIYHPYKSKSDIKVMRKPPAGAYIVKGIGSAYKTIQALGGNEGLVTSISMGIFDVDISDGGAKPTIRFTKKSKYKRKSKGAALISPRR